MMKWTLEIAPSARSIEKLVLVIPLREKLMPLFHACTDGLRFNYAGVTPAGQGRVWDGTKAPRNSIVGSYVPYIWLGAEERGLSVFGENDRGWITAAGVPCQELVARGRRLELRLNLIAKPVVLDAPRKILIGLLSTPSKPMPKGWRMWTESYSLKPPPGGKFIRFSGSCWTWGALTPCLDVYPRDEDFSIWEQFAKTKRTGQVDADFIAKWAAGFPNLTPEERKRNLSNTRWGFHILVDKPQDVLVYTNGRGVRFDTREGQTFLNEWHCDAFATRTWPAGGGVAYGLNPVESYRDYAMWYYKKMLETFVAHIYWDDIFMQSCFNVVGTEAYELSDDTIQPASGLFEMRELIRRAAVLQHEFGFTGRLQPTAHHQHRDRPDPLLRRHPSDLGRSRRHNGLPGTLEPRLHPRREHRPPARQRPLRASIWPGTSPGSRTTRPRRNASGWSGRMRACCWSTKCGPSAASR